MEAGRMAPDSESVMRRDLDRRGTGQAVAWLAVVLLVGTAGATSAGEADMRFENGLVTATFDAVPAAEAFAVIRRTTRANIVVQPALEGKVLTLTVEQVSFDLFLQRVLHALGWGNYAVVYEPDGGPGRLVIVDPNRGHRGAPPGQSGDQPRASGAPVYVPPRVPPVYLPPRDPAPTYVPPTRLPVVKRPSRLAPQPSGRPAPGSTKTETERESEE
jgi:hypothetical protein